MIDTPTTPEAALAEALAPRPWIDEPHELAEETLALLRALGWDVVQMSPEDLRRGLVFIEDDGTRRHPTWRDT